MTENEIGKIVVDLAIKIHKGLGIGLFESVYETVLCDEFKALNLYIERQVIVPIKYNNKIYSEGFRADIIIENKVILELKSLEQISRVHKKQLLTYLKLTNMKLGFLLNFGQPLMKNGITRLINGKL